MRPGPRPRSRLLSGYAVARAYAGHTDSGSEAGATATYVRASLAKWPPR